MGKAGSTHIGIGASEFIYSASFSTEIDKQDYDLQAIIYTSSLDPASEFYNKVGKKAINIVRVYYKTPSVS